MTTTRDHIESLAYRAALDDWRSGTRHASTRSHAEFRVKPMLIREVYGIEKSPMFDDFLGWAVDYYLNTFDGWRHEPPVTADGIESEEPWWR